MLGQEAMQAVWEKWRYRTFKTIRFDKKMDFFVTLSIVVVSLVLYSSTIWLLHRSTKADAMQLESQRLGSLAGNIADDLDNYKEMAIALNIADSLQQYIRSDRENDSYSYFRTVTLLSDTLRFICQLDRDIDFIAVYSDKTDDYIFQGNIGLGGKDFQTKLEQSHARSIPFDKGEIRMDYTDAFTKEGEPSVTVFFPIYSVTRLDRKLGLLCMSMQNHTLSELMFGSSNTRNMVSLVDGQGNTIVTSGANRHQGERFDEIGSVADSEGTFVHAGQQYLFASVPGSTLCLVEGIDDVFVGSELARISLVIFLIMIVLIAISLSLSRKLVQTAYAPMETVLHAMRQVENHDRLELRIDDARFGEDFVQIAQGFNAMMNEINLLISRVEEERRLKEKMRYYALQTQITPHFLYNTLECIHWQALADGNRKISSLVMALGSFYKIGLSEGKELIPLGKELEHVKNYLFIQNMRYGNIIDLAVSVDEAFAAVPIPRITLQPLVENAIYHGIRVKQGNTGRVSIDASLECEDLVVEVSDNGSVSDSLIGRMNRAIESQDGEFGFGIRNVHQRIRLGFGAAYGLSFMKNREGGLTVSIRLPYEKDGAHA
jgi:two-component system sensor histidine kinase YesM